MNLRHTAAATAALLAFTLGLSGCGGDDGGDGGGGGGSGPQDISFGLALKDDISNSPLVLAQEQGLYKRYGLNAKLVYFNGGGAMVQAMAGGQVDYGWVSHTPVIRAAAMGAPVKIIAEVSKSAVGWGLMVPPDSPIQKPEDLEKGVRISYTSEGALTNWLALYEAQLAGLEPNDVKGVPIGASLPTVITALERKQIDAATVLIPWGYTLESQGKARWVAKMPEQLPDFSYTGIDATSDAASDTKTSGCVVGAYIATIKWMKDNPEETQKWFQSFYKVDAALAERAYAELVPDFSETGELSEQRLQTTIDTISKVPGFLEPDFKADQVATQAKPLSEEECAA